MKKILRSHPNTIIIGLVLIFLAILIALYAWSINDIVLDAHQALAPAAGGSGSGFDLTGATSLNLRGLVTGPAPMATTTMATTTATTTTPVATTTPTATTTGSHAP